jgi:hypothetical protein
LRRKSRKDKTLRIRTHVKVRRGEAWHKGRITAVEVNDSRVVRYAVKLENGTVESFPSYRVEAIPRKGLVERLRARPALSALVAVGTMVGALAAVGQWVSSQDSPMLVLPQPVPPKTSVRGLWVKNLDGTKEWAHDVVLERKHRLWVSGLVQSPSTGANNAVLHVWQSTTKSHPDTSIVHLGFSKDARSPVSSSHSALVRHGRDTFLALNFASAVLTDENGNKLASLGNPSMTVPAENKWVPALLDVGPLASSDRIYFEMWSKLIPASSLQFGFTPHSIWWQARSGKVWIYEDPGTVG